MTNEARGPQQERSSMSNEAGGAQRERHGAKAEAQQEIRLKIKPPRRGHPFKSFPAALETQYTSFDLKRLTSHFQKFATKGVDPPTNLSGRA